MSRQKRRRRKKRQTYKSAKSMEKQEDCATREESAMMTGLVKITKRLDCKVSKVDTSLGLVFGWAIISSENGEPYVDQQNDWIPDSAMLKASTKYAKGDRVSGDMHRCTDGQIVHTMPLTAEIAKAFDITCPKTGWMVAMEPDNADTLAKFESGERTGFSIGGSRIRDTEVTL